MVLQQLSQNKLHFLFADIHTSFRVSTSAWCYQGNSSSATWSSVMGTPSLQALYPPGVLQFQAAMVPPVPGGHHKNTQLKFAASFVNSTQSQKKLKYHT